MLTLVNSHFILTMAIHIMNVGPQLGPDPGCVAMKAYGAAEYAAAVLNFAAWIIPHSQTVAQLCTDQILPNNVKVFHLPVCISFSHIWLQNVVFEQHGPSLVVKSINTCNVRMLVWRFF